MGAIYRNGVLYTSGPMDVSVLSNYYTKTQVDNLLAAIHSFDIEIATSLLTIDNPNTHTLYLILSGDESNNVYDFVDANITLHFSNSIGAKQESVQIHPKHIGYDYINTGWPIIVFDDELPANFDNICILEVEYEIIFHECYGGNNIRTVKSDGIENWYDLLYKTAVKEKKVVLGSDEHLQVTYELCAYAPSDCIIRLTSDESGEVYECVKNTETNTYSVTIPDRIANLGVHPVSVNLVTKISPSCNLSISSNDSITRATPVTLPLFAPSPFIELLTLVFSPSKILPISFSLI